MLIVIFIAGILTWTLPAGNFERQLNTTLGIELVVPDTYQTAEKTPIGLWSLCLCIFQGFVDSADIMFLLLFAVGYINLLIGTNSLNALVGSVLKTMGDRSYLLIPVFFILFAICGSTFGMYEEALALVPAFMAIAVALGYDKIVGAVIVVGGAGIGFAAATLNPFTVGLASSIAGISIVSSKILIFRIISFIIFVTIGILYLMHYAGKIKKDPSKSILHNEADKPLETDSRDEIALLILSLRQKITLYLFVIVVLWIAIGVIVFDFYIPELSSIFIIAMIITGLINKMSANEIAESFIQSSRSMVFTMLMIGLGRSIQIVITQGNIIDTIVLFLSNMISGFPTVISAIAMLFAQNIINFFIPSGTVQAVVSMPIMVPVADLVGLSREISVLAFQFGNGFAVMFWPTGCAIICGVMGIGLGTWYKFFTKLFLILLSTQIILIVSAVLLGI